MNKFFSIFPAFLLALIFGCDQAIEHSLSSDEDEPEVEQNNEAHSLSEIEQEYLERYASYEVRGGWRNRGGGAHPDEIYDYQLRQLIHRSGDINIQRALILRETVDSLDGLIKKLKKNTKMVGKDQYVALTTEERTQIASEATEMIGLVRKLESDESLNAVFRDFDWHQARNPQYSEFYQRELDDLMNSAEKE